MIVADSKGFQPRTTPSTKLPSAPTRAEKSRFPFHPSGKSRVNVRNDPSSRRHLPLAPQPHSELPSSLQRTQVTSIFSLSRQSTPIFHSLPTKSASRYVTSAGPATSASKAAAAASPNSSPLSDTGFPNMSTPAASSGRAADASDAAASAPSAASSAPSAATA